MGRPKGSKNKAQKASGAEIDITAEEVSAPASLRMGNTEMDLPGRGGARSVIDRMGLATEVLRMRKTGLSHIEIAVQLHLSESQVRDWLAKYQTLGEPQRKGIEERSVFNISDNLQDVFARLYTLLEEVKYENKELEVKVLDKLLKSQDQAAKLIEKVELINENRRFREVILDLLDQEAPGIKQKALAKLAQHQEGVSALRPL